MKAVIQILKTTSPGGRLAMALSLLWVLSLIACGGGGCSGCIPGCQGHFPHPTPVKPTPPPRVVKVTLLEYQIKMPQILPPGPTRFEVTNAGHRAHYLEIERQGTNIMFGLNLLPGNTKSVEVILEQGLYRVWCPFNRDEAKGMELTVRVTPAHAPAYPY
ncbi:MAG TPA: hypothetical protein VE082_01830 [Desulfobaccales bacterium]|nr:hypothetical protein [Desulfobaccales bacterium]